MPPAKKACNLGKFVPGLHRRERTGVWLIQATVATNPKEPKAPDLKEANRRLRAALEECHALLTRTEEMLRRSQQDDRPHR
jgi:hypothetical protein